MNRVIIDKLRRPVDGYLFNARITTSIDGGKTFYHCGNGRYFKTIEAAEAFKKEFDLHETEGAEQGENNGL